MKSCRTISVEALAMESDCAELEQWAWRISDFVGVSIDRMRVQ